jgi:hypothetical protein
LIATDRCFQHHQHQRHAPPKAQKETIEETVTKGAINQPFCSLTTTAFSRHDETTFGGGKWKGGDGQAPIHLVSIADSVFVFWYFYCQTKAILVKKCHFGNF